MKNKNYKKALSYITAARVWPENLGVGKPYESDIDERLEDWLAYQIYLKLKNEKAAQQMLDKIIAFTNTNKKLNSSANDLVSAWALQKTKSKDEGEKFLQQQVDKNPNNNMAKWTLNMYQEKHFEIPEGTRTNVDYRVLQQLLAME